MLITTILAILIASVLPYPVISTAEPDVPFTIDVEPEKLTAEPGDEVTYNLRIDAEEGFSDSIDLELQLSGLGFSIILDLGRLDPPYSKEIEVTVNIPSDIPEMNAQGILRGISGDHVVEKYLEINIQGKSGRMRALWRAIENLEKALMNAWRAAIQRLLDMIKAINRMRSRALEGIQKILP